MQRLVVIGNGMAGVRTVEELLRLAPGAYEISIFGAEPHPNYNRILLSPLLGGEKSLSDIVLNGDEWYAEHGIRLYKGSAVTRIDRAARRVVAGDGICAQYDRLLLATGSRPVVLPLPGVELPGVVTFRDINDVETMLAACRGGRHAVVIGGGLLGLEAAAGLHRRGMDVTVVHLLDSLLDRQLDRAASGLLRATLEQRGLRFLMQAKTEAILGAEAVQAVRFADGRELPADLVVMAVGIRPNIELAKAAGLYCERGVVVGDTLQTYDPCIYAVGECVQHRRQTYGLVAPLFEQARVCANHLAELAYARYEGSVTATRLKVTGVDLFSAGDFQGGDGTEEVIFQDPARGVYKKLVLRDRRIVGTVLYGDTLDGSWYFDLMRDRVDVSDIREGMIFGRNALGDAGHGGEVRVAAMTDSAEICGCNGVCKGTIVRAILDKKLFTVDQVRAHTKASSSCGSCTGLVEQLLAHTLGGSYSPAPAERSLCECADFSHDEVRRVIREQRLLTVRAVMDYLEWRTPDGCHKCRPALNYYVIAAWPSQAQDDPQSRLINERAHANIQKDGTYSVVPRMWGGMTSAAELRAIADVVDRFQIPTVKVTGGQRIDLLGVKKEQLPAVWTELGRAGFVSGHAYGKAVRTVKTCVGSEWCRFGTQDSTAMGIRMERLCWGAWTPAKVKMAVSGCPRNCAESTIKDFGVVAVDSGWELHVGGNGGVKVRATELLCKVETQEQVLEHCAAFLQLYREEGRYLERTAHWIERVGMSYLRQRLVDDGHERPALAQRFAESQRFSQSDPWAAHARADLPPGEFTPLRRVG